MAHLVQLPTNPFLLRCLPIDIIVRNLGIEVDVAASFVDVFKSRFSKSKVGDLEGDMTQYKHCNIDVSLIIILHFGAIRCETSSKEVLLQYGGESINVPVLRVVAGLMGEGLSSWTFSCSPRTGRAILLRNALEFCQGKAGDRSTSWIIPDSGQPRTLPQPLGGVETTGLCCRNHPDNHSPRRPSQTEKRNGVVQMRAWLSLY